MQTDSKNPQGNEANTSLYTVRVICWDGVEYTREATKDEIDTQRKKRICKRRWLFGNNFRLPFFAWQLTDGGFAVSGAF